MKKLSRFILLLIIAALSVGNTYAHEFKFEGSSVQIADSLKSRIDLFVEKRIYSNYLKDKYLTLLNRIDKNRLSTEKLPILYYFIVKIDPTRAKALGTTTTTDTQNHTNINTTTGSTTNTVVFANDGTITNDSFNVNNPIIPAKSLIPNTPRTNSIGQLSSDIQSYLNQIKGVVREYAETNDNLEFNEYSRSYLVKIKEYYIVDTKNPVKGYLQLAGIGSEILLKKGSTYIISKGGYKVEQKLSIEDLVRRVKLSTTSEDAVLFGIKDNYFYAYGLYNYKYFNVPSDGIFLSQYSSLGDVSNALLIYKGGKYSLVTDFTTDKLFPTSYLKNSYNPLGMLQAVGKDLYYYKRTNLESVITELKTRSSDIVPLSSTTQDKINKIYSWVTANIAYDPYTIQFIDGKFDEKTYLTNVNSEVFSGLGAYNNKQAVCDGYTKIMLYLLEFAGVKNVSIETGKADIGNGRLISHAWVRIGDKLFDPTWDIYSKGEQSKFKWFAIDSTEFYKLHFKGE